jgi:dephospho-CoA kinase
MAILLKNRLMGEAQVKGKIPVIGLMGGIGAGKSYIMDLMEQNFNVLCIKSDEISRKQLMPGQKAYKSVVENFGKGILDNDGAIDRNKLAAEIFANDAKRMLLNSLTHPPVIEELKKIIEEASGYEALVIESALIVSAGIGGMFDKIWLVSAPREQRIERLINKRGYTRDKAIGIMERQDSDEEFEKYADEVIFNVNGGSKEELLCHIRKLFEDTAINI